MQFYRYLRLILKRWWIIALLVVVSVASVYYYTSNLPPVYSTQTSLFLNPSTASSLLPYVDSTYVSNLADNYNITIKSEKFLTSVQSKLQPAFNISIDELRGSFTTRLQPNTEIYVITASSDTPQKAQAIANTVAQAFVDEGVRQNDAGPSASQSSLASEIQIQNDDLQRTNNEIKSLNAQINALLQQTATDKTNQQSQELRQELRDDLQYRTQLFSVIADLNSRLADSSKSSAQILDKAALPIERESNGLYRDLIFALVASFALGAGVIILLDYLDYTVKSADELTELTGLTTMGAVSVIKPVHHRSSPVGAAADSAAPEEPLDNLSDFLVTVTDFKSIASESYRNIRTNLLFQATASSNLIKDKNLDEDPFKLLLVTSTVAGEGKSLTASNLAIAFAQAGSKVVLVDTDLRRPTIHKLFGLSNDKGFTNLVLTGPANLSSIIKPTSVPNLAVITAGSLPPNPSELLTGVHAARLLDVLAEVADVVVLDSPPVGVVTDAVVLANRADRVLLVVDWGSTRRDAVLRTVQNLNKVGAKISGTILNRVQDKHADGYYYYYYGERTGKPRNSKGGLSLSNPGKAKSKVIVRSKQD